VTELAKSKTPQLAEFLACRIPSVQVSPILPFGRCSFRSSDALLFFEGVTKIVRWNAISVKILNSHRASCWGNRTYWHPVVITAVAEAYFGQNSYPILFPTLKTASHAVYDGGLGRES
jgi:hypothetical protein